MMRQARVYCRDILAGTLGKGSEEYVFEYQADYLANPNLPAISLTFQKQKEAFRSPVLFPFFFGLLAEGEKKSLDCRILRIDEDDHFTRLLKTCSVETIGGVTVEEIQ